jgi:hypothetical protein
MTLLFFPKLGVRLLFSSLLSQPILHHEHNTSYVRRMKLKRACTCSCKRFKRNYFACSWVSLWSSSVSSSQTLRPLNVTIEFRFSVSPLAYKVFKFSCWSKLIFPKKGSNVLFSDKGSRWALVCSHSKVGGRLEKAIAFPHGLFLPTLFAG